MRKLSLKVEELRVESFEIAAGATPRGTVYGHSNTAVVAFSCGDQPIDYRESAGRDWSCGDPCLGATASYCESCFATCAHPAVCGPDTME